MSTVAHLPVSGHARQPRAYTMTLSDLEQLADAIAMLDGYVEKDVKPFIDACHEIIRTAAGEDVGLIYAEDDAA